MIPLSNNQSQETTNMIPLSNNQSQHQTTSILSCPVSDSSSVFQLVSPASVEYNKSRNTSQYTHNQNTYTIHQNSEVNPSTSAANFSSIAPQSAPAAGAEDQLVTVEGLPIVTIHSEGVNILRKDVKVNALLRNDKTFQIEDCSFIECGGDGSSQQTKHLVYLDELISRDLQPVISRDSPGISRDNTTANVVVNNKQNDQCNDDW